MNIRQLSPFGAEVSDLDCAADGVDHQIVADLIARHRVLVLRGQRCDDQAFVQLLSGFGPLVFTEGELPVAGFPMLNVVSNVGRATPPVSRFHTDSSYFACPPSFTALRPVSLPGKGGATLFSDQVRAARELPEDWKQCLEGRKVLHQCTGLEGIDEQAWHPLFRRHPVTGETTLYLSTPARCIALEGVEPVPAKRILTMLYRRSQRTAGLYRHEWQPGDLLIWDNRVTMHRADHDQVMGQRILHRGMVAGEKPIPADGALGRPSQRTG